MSETHNSNFDILRSKGYCLIKNFFNPDEVQNLRLLVEKNKHKTQDVYLSIAESGFGNVLLSSKYFELLKSILGKDLIYYQDSHLLIDTDKKIPGKFHIDARDDDEDPETSDYKVWRVGIYLQDHKNFSGGIKMISNSHKKLLLTTFKKFYYILIKILKKKIKFSIKSFIPSFKYENVPSEPGDIIIWNGRTHHSGRFKRLKFLKNFPLHPFFDRILPNFFFIKENDHRLVIFQNWCLKDHTSYKYIKYRLSEFNSKEYWEKNEKKNSKFPSKNFEDASIKIYR